MIAIDCCICHHSITKGRERVRMQNRMGDGFGAVCDHCMRKQKKTLKILLTRQAAKR